MNDEHAIRAVMAYTRTQREKQTMTKHQTRKEKNNQEP
jgi:hypothetical protein